MTERRFAPSVMLSGAFANDEHKRNAQERTTMITNVPPTVAEARAVAQRDGIPFEVAHARVLAAARDHLKLLRRQPAAGDAPSPGAGSQHPAMTASIPPLPPAGALSHAQAKAHLSKHMPGFGALGWDHQFAAMQILRDLCADQKATAQLGRSHGGKPTLLLCLYPGGTRHAAAQTYLAATVDGWEKLPYDDRWTRIQALLRTHNVMEIEEGQAHE